MYWWVVSETTQPCMLQNQYSSHLDFLSWPLNPKSDAFPFVRYVFIEVNTQNCTWPHFISNNYFLIKSPNVDQFCLLCLRSDCHIVILSLHCISCSLKKLTFSGLVQLRHKDMFLGLQPKCILASVVKLGGIIGKRIWKSRWFPLD